MIIPHSFYTDGQVFETKKESYIAITNDKGGVVFFAHIGYKSVRITEGTAILKALEYLKDRSIYHATIYTDSMDWAGAVHNTHIIKQNQDAESFLIFKKIMVLKEELSVTIHWKHRSLNQAGIFLGSVWRVKKRKRQKPIEIFD